MRKKRIVLSPGEVVKELRTKKGWSQAILSELTGIAITNLSNIENGRSRLGEDRAIIFAAAFGVKPEFILFPNGFQREDLKPRLKQIERRLKKLDSDVNL